MKKMKCKICKAEYEFIVNDEPLCKIHFILGIAVIKDKLIVTTNVVE